MNNLNADYDMVIVGAGTVGLTLACALVTGPANLRIAVLEQREPGTPVNNQVDLRVSALTHASQRILTRLGVWPAISSASPFSPGPFREMRVWDSQGWGEIHFDSADIGQATLGWIVENGITQRALWQQAELHSNIDIFCPAILDQLESQPDKQLLHLSDGRKFSARLVVAADGGQSKVRELAHIDCIRRAYQQHALVTTVTTEHAHQETAWQRFLASGPLAFLPLADGRCSIVWSTTPSQAEALLALPEQTFCNALAEAFDWRLGEITQVAEKAVFPLHLLHARQYTQPRLALIGDAAHVVHPLAGQGVNLGILDAASLAEVVLEAVAKQQDIGSLAVLRRYERWRKGDNVLMLGVLDGFKHLFGTSFGPVRLVRNVGLNLAAAVTPLKNTIMRRSIGLVGDVPQLARLQPSQPGLRQD